MTSPRAFSMEAEQSVLGGLLIDSSRLHEVGALIDAGSFGHRPHGHIFKAIAELVGSHKLADIVTVHDRLRVAGLADDCGGLAYLKDLAQSVPSASSAARYASLVADYARRRELLRMADDVPAMVATADSADAVVDQLQATLSRLQRIKGGSEPQTLASYVQEALAEINAIAAGDRASGWSTGLATLDKALGGGLKPGRVVVIAARTSVGKTSLATQILLQCGADGHPGLMLSQEMTGTELAFRALTHAGRIALDRLTVAEMPKDEWEALPAAADQLSALPVWIDAQPALRMVDIAAKARAMQRRHGLRVLVVDYLQLTAAEPVKGQSRHHQIEIISRGIKALAKELGICVLLLSQLNRSAEDGEPELWHLKESGSTEEDADAVLLLHVAGNEPGGAQVVCCKVAKNRGGKRGRLALSFDGRYQRWMPSTADVSRGAKA